MGFLLFPPPKQNKRANKCASLQNFGKCQLFEGKYEELLNLLILTSPYLFYFLNLI